jgi:hypothetical protein
MGSDRSEGPIERKRSPALISGRGMAMRCDSIPNLCLVRVRVRAAPSTNTLLLHQRTIGGKPEDQFWARRTSSH